MVTYTVMLACKGRERNSHVGLGQRCRRKHNDKHTDTSRQTRMFCLWLTSPHRRAQWMPVLYIGNSAWSVRTNKKEEKHLSCASTHTYLMLFADCCSLIYFDICIFYFPEVCEYINMYYWWCVVVQSTRMRGFFFIQKMFLNYYYFFYSGCSYWGRRLLGRQYRCVSASNKVWNELSLHVVDHSLY